VWCWVNVILLRIRLRKPSVRGGLDGNPRGHRPRCRWPVSGAGKRGHASGGDRECRVKRGANKMQKGISKNVRQKMQKETTKKCKAKKMQKETTKKCKAKKCKKRTSKKVRQKMLRGTSKMQGQKNAQKVMEWVQSAEPRYRQHPTLLPTLGFRLKVPKWGGRDGGWDMENG